jgi:hypothetical protein
MEFEATPRPPPTTTTTADQTILCTTGSSSSGSHGILSSRAESSLSRGNTKKRDEVAFDTTLNRYYDRRGQWLNKTELYYSKTQLKEMKADALVYAKSLEEEQDSSSSSCIATKELRGCEGVAPKLLRIKLERRHQAREVVIQEQTKQREECQGGLDAERLATMYQQVAKEALEAALQLAEEDSKDAMEIRKSDQEQALLLLVKQKKQEDGTSSPEQSPTQIPPENGNISFPLPSTLTSSRDIRKESLSLHTDFSSVSSEVMEDVDFSGYQTKHPRNYAMHIPSSLRLKKAVSFIGRRLSRGTTTKTRTSSSSLPNHLQQ